MMRVDGGEDRIICQSSPFVFSKVPKTHDPAVKLSRSQHIDHEWDLANFCALKFW